MDDIDVFVPKYQISIGSDTMSGAVFYVGFDGGGLPTVQYLQNPAARHDWGRDWSSGHLDIYKSRIPSMTLNKTSAAMHLRSA